MLLSIKGVMPCKLVLLLILFSLRLSAQEIFEVNNCPYVSTAKSIDSKFYHLTLQIPEGWSVKLEGELPVLYLANKEFDCSLIITKAYDVTGLISEAEAILEPGSYKIVNRKNVKILIQTPSKTKDEFSLMICNKENSKNTWIWKCNLYCPVDKINLLRCHLSFIIDQLLDNP